MLCHKSSSTTKLMKRMVMTYNIESGSIFMLQTQQFVFSGSCNWHHALHITQIQTTLDHAAICDSLQCTAKCSFFHLRDTHATPYPWFKMHFLRCALSCVLEHSSTLMIEYSAADICKMHRQSTTGSQTPSSGTLLSIKNICKQIFVKYTSDICKVFLECTSSPPWMAAKTLLLESNCQSNKLSNMTRRTNFLAADIF